MGVNLKAPHRTLGSSGSPGRLLGSRSGRAEQREGATLWGVDAMARRGCAGRAAMAVSS